MIRKLVITLRAREQYKEIGRFTEAEWGRSQRVKYLRQLKDAFERLRTRPDSRKVFKGAGITLNYVRMSKHYIFYEFTTTEVVVAAILHTKQDPSLHL